MNKCVILFISVNILFSSGFAQSLYSLEGIVLNKQKQPLEGASVQIKELNKGVVTDSSGYFVFKNLTQKFCTVQVDFSGYKTWVESVSAVGLEKHIFHLQLVSTNLNEVELIESITEQRIKENPLTIEIVNEKYIKQNLGGSLMKSLERLPGVATIEIGSGQSKPVIRGLSFNRVVVVENNVKHQAQQWGADHGLEIDQYAAENIEVVKGPASLMYGSDALGGVVNVKSNLVPTMNTYGGSLDFVGRTNNDLLGTSALLYARKGKYFVTMRATVMDYGDYKVPTDSIDIYGYRAGLHKNYLRNTAGEEINFNTSFGLIQKKFKSVFFVSSVNSKSGFFANTRGLEPTNVDTELHDRSNRDILLPYQNVSHFKVTNSSSYRWERYKLDFDFGYQKNIRQEWSQYVQHGFMPPTIADSSSNDQNLEREFLKNVYALNAKLFYVVNEKTQLNFGLNGELQTNEIGGYGFIIPEYSQHSLGAFIFVKHKLNNRSNFLAGIRYDHSQLHTKEYYDWFQSPQVNNGDTTYVNLQRAADLNRNFSNFSWSIGYNYLPGDWIFKVNVGKSFRMPLAQELASNGVNYHRFSYEVGNPNLSPEISYQLDAGVSYSTSNYAAGITPFVNYFTNYIYLNPTAEHDRLYGNGNQVFRYTESEVFRYGSEFHAHYQISKFWRVGAIGEYVYSLQMSGVKEGYTLPFAPPATAVLNLKYQRAAFDASWLESFENTYASIDYKIVAPQNSIVPPEEVTKGFQVVNLSFGGQIIIKNQQVNINLQVQNLFNTKYFNHMSYYRLINVPEPGRNFVVNISVPLSSTFN